MKLEALSLMKQGNFQTQIYQTNSLFKTSSSFRFFSSMIEMESQDEWEKYLDSDVPVVL